MQNTRIIFDNLWQNGTLLAASSEDPQCPKEYTQDDDTTLVWKTASGAISGVTIDCDFGSALPFNYISLLNQNFSAGVTATIKGADNSGFSTNVVTVTLTYNMTNLRQYFSTMTKRYCRITITDSGNAYNCIQIGTIIVGQYRDLGSQPLKGIGDGVNPYDQTEKSPSGNLFMTQESAPRRAFTFTWTPSLSDTAKGYWISLLQRNRLAYAFEICFDYTDPNNNTYWVVLTEMDIPKNVSGSPTGMRWNFTVSIEEHA